MAELTVGKRVYRTGRLDCREQFHVGRRLAPMLDELRDAARKVMPPPPAEGAAPAPAVDFLEALSGPIANGIAAMKQEDADYILDRCLAVAQRKQSETVWSAVANAKGQVMFDDMTLSEMMRIVVVTLAENLGNFIAGDQAPP